MALAADLLGGVMGFVDSYGILAILILLILDAAMLLPVIPGEVLLILATNRYVHDPWSLAFVVLAASTAATIGGSGLYAVARGGGRTFILAHPRIFLISPKTRERLERTFARPAGQSLVMFLRLVPLARILVNLPAGLARMPFVRYVVLSFVGNLAFHGAFMWFAYETRRPESAVAVRSEELRAAYASPAFQFVQVNWLAAAIVLVGFALILSLRASAKALRNPHQAWEGSLIGNLVANILAWGGIALLVGVWMEPQFVYEMIAKTGVDLRTVPLDVPFKPDSIAVGLGVIAIFMGWLVASVRRAARRRHEHAKTTAIVRPRRRSDPVSTPGWSGTLPATDRPAPVSRGASRRDAGTRRP